MRKFILMSLALGSLTLVFISSAWFTFGETPTASAQTGCAIDLMLVIDGSGSIADEDFAYTKDFMHRLIGSFIVGPEDANIGIIQFSNTPEVYISISDDPDAINRAIDNMTQFGDRTNIAGAIKMAQEQFIARRENPRVIIVMTDGNHNMEGNPIAEADRARVAGTTLFGIAVGAFDSSELAAISGGAQNMITVGSFEGLGVIIGNILTNACSVTTAQAAAAAPTPVSIQTTPAVPPPTEVAGLAPTGESFAETLLAFASDRDGDFDIYTMSPDGGAVRQLTDNAVEDDNPSWSPDGQFIVYQSAAENEDYELWTVNVTNGERQQVTNNTENEESPAWSPDGSTFAFVSNRDGDYEIYLMKIDGSDMRQITNNDAEDLGPAWSPDGRQLVYFSDKTGGREIFTYDLATEIESQLSSDDTYDGEPGWSPDNTRIAFSSNRTTSSDLTDLMVMNADGSNAVQITDDPATDEQPVWSLDNQEIAFSSGRDGTFDLWLMEADGTNLRKLTDDPGVERSPAWGGKFGTLGAGVAQAAPTTQAPVVAAASNQIVFASDLDGDFEIYVISSQGGGVRQLTNNDGFDDNPTWSPDGTQIAWDGAVGEGNDDIYVMNADGSNVRQLTSDPSDEQAAAWSPDGTRLAFASNRFGDYDIFIMNADGSSVQQITESSGDDLAPAWSPDGTQLAYHSDKSGGREIYILDLTTEIELRLTSNEIYEGEVDWSPDGSQIVFSSNLGSTNELPNLFVMNADGTNVQQLTNDDGTDEKASWSPDGTQIVFESGRSGFFDLWLMNADGSNVRQLTDDAAVSRSADWH